MKKYRKLFILPIALSCCVLMFCFNTNTKSYSDDLYNDIVIRVQKILQSSHFGPKEIDDAFSEKVFDQYINSLDNSKRFFLQEDLDEFFVHKKQMDDYFKNGDLAFYDLSIDRLYQRIEELNKEVIELLSSDFDYDKDEYLIINDEEKTYAKNKKVQLEYWEKYLKASILEEISALQKITENKEKSFEELEKIAKEDVRENMVEFFRRFKSRKKKDWLSIYINSFTEQYDPHTAYFSPKEKENFDFSMSGQLEGIGARLQDKKGYATIIELIVGGPAWKSKEIEVGDQILKVKEKNSVDATNIVGMLLDDAVRLIRGKKGSTVILSLKKADGSLKEVSIVRNVIEYDDAFAKSAIILGKDQKKYGLIYLPEFYANFQDKNGSDASNDILKNIIELKKENIDGIVFDVRGNGGGSLQEVVEIAGFFIKKGPIVQVSSSSQSSSVQSDNDANIYWDGPVVVLVDELSASASEILAAALMDYNRAIVIGGPKTYGKGTVQKIRYVSNVFSFGDQKDEMGSIKLTTDKFYRINGESTQLKGVESDIIIPDKYTYADISESSQKNALAWDEIKGLKYDKWKLNKKSIVRKSIKRTANSEQVSLIKKNALWFKELQETDSISIQKEKYFAEKKLREQKSDSFKKIDDYKNGLQFENLAFEKQTLAIDTMKMDKRKNWHEQLNKDFYLEEAIYVLADMH